MTKDDLITIVEHYVPKKPDMDSVLSAIWDYSEALIAAKPIVSGSLELLATMLKEEYKAHALNIDNYTLSTEHSYNIEAINNVIEMIKERQANDR